MSEDNEPFRHFSVGELLVGLEVSFKNFESFLNKELIELKVRIEQQRNSIDHLSDIVKVLCDKQQTTAPVLETLEALVKASFVVKWIVIFSMSILGVFAATVSALDALKKFK